MRNFSGSFCFLRGRSLRGGSAAPRRRRVPRPGLLNSKMTTRFGGEVIFRATKPLLFFQPRFRTYRKSSELFSRTHQLTNSVPTIVWDVLLFRPLFAAYQPVVQDSKKKNSVQRPQPSIHHRIADWRSLRGTEGYHARSHARRRRGA